MYRISWRSILDNKYVNYWFRFMLTGSTPKNNSIKTVIRPDSLSSFMVNISISQNAWDHLLHDLLRSFILLLLHLDANRQRNAALPARHRQPPRSYVAAVGGWQVFVLIPGQHYLPSSLQTDIISLSYDISYNIYHGLGKTGSDNCDDECVNDKLNWDQLIITVWTAQWRQYLGIETSIGIGTQIKALWS